MRVAREGGKIRLTSRQTQDVPVLATLSLKQQLVGGAVLGSMSGRPPVYSHSTIDVPLPGIYPSSSLLGPVRR